MRKVLVAHFVCEEEDVSEVREEVKVFYSEETNVGMDGCWCEVRDLSADEERKYPSGRDV